jgi:hypothetical protein
MLANLHDEMRTTGARSRVFGMIRLATFVGRGLHARERSAMKPKWGFVLLWPITVAFVAIVSLSGYGWLVQWGTGLLVYVGMVSVLLSLVALRARGSGRRLQLRPSRRRTSRIPDAVTDTLPKAVWVVRNREPARAERILLDGPLLKPGNVAYTAVLAPALAIALIQVADGQSLDDDARTGLLAESEEVAEVLPVAVDSAHLGEWLEQLTGGTVTHRFNRAGDFDLAALACLLVISAAAASRGGLMRPQIYRHYQAIEASFEHGYKFPPGWASRATEAS